MRVLIVGAGIGGLTLARALNRIGMRPTIIEAAATLEPPGLGLSVQSNAIRAADTIGLGEAIRSGGVQNGTMVTRDLSGTELGSVGSAARRGHYGPTMAIHRNALMRASAEGLDADIRLATQATSITGDGDTIGVEFGGKREEYDLVVGADGSRSWVGEAVFGESGRTYRGYRAWRTLAALEDTDPHNAVMRRGPGLFVGSFPVSTDHLYLFVLEHGPDDEASRAEPWRHIRRVAERLDPESRALYERVDEDSPVAYTPVYEVDRPAWVQGRVVLIGDAAHAIAPMFAQGAAMAIEDAVLLGEELGRDGATEAALARWEEHRRPRVTMVRDICQFGSIAAGLEGAVDPARLADHPGNVGDMMAMQTRLFAGIDGLGPPAAVAGG